ncbi:MAG: Gfo/Idh/MocA family protein [Christensenellales bacterium]
MMTDFPKAKGLRVTAVASRSPERARAAAEKYSIPHAFGSYEELAECPDVDLVYVAVPHHRHMECAKLCMEHKKHVLCEKPMALNDMQVRHMREVAAKNGVFLMEAMWTRFFPLSEKLRELVSSGAIGDVRLITSNFAGRSTYRPQVKDRIFDPEQGGGALLDLGVYNLSAASMLLGNEPVEVSSFVTKAETGVDGTETIQLLYENGAMAQLFSSVEFSGNSTQCIFGTEGRITIPDFWHPTRMEVVSYRDGCTVQYAFPAENEGFYHEFLHVRDCILRGLSESPIMPLAETEQIHAIMTRLRREWGVFYPGEEDFVAEA